MSRTIAVVGASADRSKFGNKCVRAYADSGWEVYPINLEATEIEGLRAYRTVAEAQAESGKPLDRISLYLPPQVTASILSELAAAEAAETFFNPGSADPDVLGEAAALGIRVREACSIVDIGRSPSEFPST